jgi:hypothetical protein
MALFYGVTPLRFVRRYPGLGVFSCTQPFASPRKLITLKVEAVISTKILKFIYQFT